MGKTQRGGKPTRAEAKTNQEISGLIGISSKFATLNKLITRDLNNNTNTPTFSLYSKMILPHTWQTHIHTKSNCEKRLFICTAQVLISED